MRFTHKSHNSIGQIHLFPHSTSVVRLIWIIGTHTQWRPDSSRIPLPHIPKNNSFSFTHNKNPNIPGKPSQHVIPGGSPSHSNVAIFSGILKTLPRDIVPLRAKRIASKWVWQKQTLYTQGIILGPAQVPWKFLMTCLCLLESQGCWHKDMHQTAHAISHTSTSELQCWLVQRVEEGRGTLEEAVHWGLGRKNLLNQWFTLLEKSYLEYFYFQ